MDRVFQVVNSGITATLKNMTITGGQAVGGNFGYVPAACEGGGLLNSGGANVTLQGVTFSKDAAIGARIAQRAERSGGAVYSNGGALNVNNCTFSHDSAIGGAGLDGTCGYGYGGFAFGAALSTSQSVLAVSNSTFSFNTAQGGAVAPGCYGGAGGGAYGGGMEIFGGTAKLSALIVSANSAIGGSGGSGDPWGGDGGDAPPAALTSGPLLPPPRRATRPTISLPAAAAPPMAAPVPSPLPAASSPPTSHKAVAAATAWPAMAGPAGRGAADCRSTPRRP